MLKDNLVILRKLNGYSQEEIAEKIDITRQAYAKWENGATTPDVEKAARDNLGMKGGDRFIVASDNVGIALIPAEYFEGKMREIMERISK